MDATTFEGAKPRVLIVDDDESIRDLLCDLLIEEGYLVEVAHNGAEAVRMATANPPATVLMDLMMPVLSGVDAAAAMKRDPRTSAVPVIAMSAGRNIDLLKNAIVAEEFLPKPFDIDQVIAVVAKHTANFGK